MVITKEQSKFFKKALLKWHALENDRTLPWKGVADMYAIWLSEILLQQTRAAQGLPYFEKFIKTFPTITDLANADDAHVYKLWQGLGYYNRCKNMLATARIIRDSYGGAFPNTYEEILALKGIGPYTAAAIASFGLKLPYAVIDGNVYRIISRVFGIETPIDTTIGKKLFATIAQQLLDEKTPDLYNQAIMDLGATICTPQNPLCNICPLHSICKSKNSALIKLLPIKEKRIAVKERWFNYFVLIYKDSVYLQQRKDGDIWSGLYEFYLVESDKEHFKSPHILDINSSLIKEITWVATSRQKLTHQLIHSCFFITKIKKIPSNFLEASFVPISKIDSYAFPKTIVSFLERKDYF